MRSGSSESQPMRSPLSRRALALTVLVATSVAACSGGGKADVAPDTTAASTTTASTTTTAVPTPDAPAAPLTGVPVSDPAVLTRPAIIFKVDNADAKNCDDNARPQVGLNQADVVFEILVEGITRFMAVYHSRIPALVEPIRSARSSDPDLLRAFVKPLFGWSGNNGNVQNDLNAISKNYVNVGHASSLGSSFYRDKDRCAPHNLVVSPQDLLDQAGSEGQPPTPIFTYRKKGESAPANAAPVGGIEVTTGGEVLYSWNTTTASWDRYQKRTLHTDSEDKVISPQNVLVLVTKYIDSSTAGSPEAVTTGEGVAYILTDGKAIAGTWKRAENTDPWTLLDEAGTPVSLTPGKTWVSLARSGQETLLSVSDVAGKIG
jgi:hypothetical protein